MDILARFFKVGTIRKSSKFTKFKRTIDDIYLFNNEIYLTYLACNLYYKRELLQQIKQISYGDN